MRWARSASKHRVARASSAYVIEHCGLIYLEAAPPGASARSQRLVYLGDDASGRALEVVGVELAGGTLFVIHSMPLRPKYRSQYQEAIRWRR